MGHARLLSLCEGIVTGLAAMAACPGLPGRAGLSAAGVEGALLPPEARRVVILADHDASGAGLRAAEAAAAKLRLDGRRLTIVFPPREGDDFNDMLLREGAGAIAALVDREREGPLRMRRELPRLTRRRARPESARDPAITPGPTSRRAPNGSRLPP